jgi:lysophospholipase L1-like esterase
MMTSAPRTYLALGDSMSIDLYTSVDGGGAVSQFYAWLKWLGQPWALDDRTCNGCCMPQVPESATGHVITLTIGGNDLLFNQDDYLMEGLEAFASEHLHLLKGLRASNPNSLIIVGNIYAPQTPLRDELANALDQANAVIAENIQKVDARLADIRGAFRGREQEYLCLEIEPNHKGATAITGLFKEIVVKTGGI